MSKETICDTFVSGLISNAVHQYLFENKTFDHVTAFYQARSWNNSSLESYFASQKIFTTAAAFF